MQLYNHFIVLYSIIYCKSKNNYLVQNSVTFLDIGKPYRTNHSRKTILKERKRKKGRGGRETMSGRPPANLSDQACRKLMSSKLVVESKQVRSPHADFFSKIFISYNVRPVNLMFDLLLGNFVHDKSIMTVTNCSRKQYLKHEKINDSLMSQLQCFIIRMPRTFIELLQPLSN